MKFVGRFSVETFAVAPGTGAAPVVHDTGTIKDASTNPPFAPVHTYHVGVWFNSGVDAAAARCANAVTPFNGDHTAGPQALSTRSSPTPTVRCASWCPDLDQLDQTVRRSRHHPMARPAYRLRFKRFQPRRRLRLAVARFCSGLINPQSTPARPVSEAVDLRIMVP